MNERMSPWGAQLCGQNACSEVGGVRAAPPGEGEAPLPAGRERERSLSGRCGDTLGRRGVLP